jgi:hypothetical protein
MKFNEQDFDAPKASPPWSSPVKSGQALSCKLKIGNNLGSTDQSLAFTKSGPKTEPRLRAIQRSARVNPSQALSKQISPALQTKTARLHVTGLSRFLAEDSWPTVSPRPSPL